MGYTPDVFYRLLYSELVLILDGYRERVRRELTQRREESAWMVSWLLLPHKKADSDPITPDRLMGRKRKEKPAPRFANKEAQANALIDALRAKSKKRGLTDGR